jgi:hypothetical protein
VYSCCAALKNESFHQKNIRLLAEKYHHRVGYDKEVILVEGSFNRIRIEKKLKEEMVISYNTTKEVERLEIPQIEIYDILIELLRRNQPDRVKRKGGSLLTLQVYRQEEGNTFDQWLKELKIEIHTTGSTHKELGGNRILTEYYKGLLILTDDLVYYLSNVIELEK